MLIMFIGRSVADARVGEVHVASLKSYQGGGGMEQEPVAITARRERVQGGERASLNSKRPCLIYLISFGQGLNERAPDVGHPRGGGGEMCHLLLMISFVLCFTSL